MRVYWSEGQLRNEHEERIDTLWGIVANFHLGYSTGQHDVPDFLEEFYNMLHDATDGRQ